MASYRPRDGKLVGTHLPRLPVSELVAHEHFDRDGHLLWSVPVLTTDRSVLDRLASALRVPLRIIVDDAPDGDG